MNDRSAYRPPDPFRCDVRQDGATTFVRPVGELDLDTADELRRVIGEVRAEGATVVLDLRGLDFMDSTGLRLVLEHADESRRDGFDFAVVPGSDVVQRVFRLTGTEAMVRIVDAPDLT